jgi:hypothetical protein
VRRGSWCGLPPLSWGAGWLVGVVYMVGNSRGRDLKSYLQLWNCESSCL